MQEYRIDVTYVQVPYQKFLIIWENREKWLGFSREVIKGYNRVNPLTAEEQNSIKSIFYLIELIMIIYFAENNYNKISDINIKMIN